MKILTTFLGLLAFLATSSVWADVQSGLTADSKVPALKVVAATGDQAGQEADFAAQRKDKPTIYIFVPSDKFDRPMARFIKTVDQTLASQRNDVQIIAVWLPDDVAQSKEYLPRAQNSLNLSQTVLAVHPGGKGGAGDWGINPDAHITVVVAEGGKVSASFGFISVNETNAPAIIEKLKPKQ